MCASLGCVATERKQKEGAPPRCVAIERKHKKRVRP
jgi:hypothetical protein